MLRDELPRVGKPEFRRSFANLASAKRSFTGRLKQRETSDVPASLEGRSLAHRMKQARSFCRGEGAIELSGKDRGGQNAYYTKGRGSLI